MHTNSFPWSLNAQLYLCVCVCVKGLTGAKSATCPQKVWVFFYVLFCNLVHISHPVILVEEGSAAPAAAFAPVLLGLHPEPNNQ